MYAAPRTCGPSRLRFPTCASRPVADGNNKGMWLGMLDPGTYTFKVRYRSTGLTFTSGSDWNVWKLEVVQL